MITSKIKNYPAYWMALAPAGGRLPHPCREHFKAEFRTASVQKLEVRDGEKIITLKDGSEIAAGAIIGQRTSFRKQGCPGEHVRAWALPTAPYMRRGVLRGAGSRRSSAAAIRLWKKPATTGFASKFI